MSINNFWVDKDGYRCGNPPACQKSWIIQNGKHGGYYSQPEYVKELRNAHTFRTRAIAKRTCFGADVVRRVLLFKNGKPKTIII
jgi:hypothetical protein